MKNINLIGLTILVALAFSSCSKTAIQGKMIPKEAVMAIVVNMKSVSSKLSWDEIKEAAWFQAALKDSNTTAWQKQLMGNPELSGIDTKSDQVFFLLKNVTDGEVVFVGDIKDRALFETFNKHSDSSSNVTKDGNQNFKVIKNKAVLGWNDNKFVFVGGFDIPSQNINASDSMAHPMKQVSTDKLSSICKRIFLLSKDSSLAVDEKFSTLVSEEGDAHLWINIEQLTRNSLSMGMLGMLKLDKLFEGNLITATANFENGKILVKQKTYAGKDLSDILKKYSGGTVDNEIIKHLPSSGLATVIGLHYKPEAIPEFMKLAGIDGLANIVLAQAGISLDEIIKANKGDVVFGISNVKLKTDSVPAAVTDSGTSHFQAEMSTIFAVSINDKDAFEKLMNAARKMSAEKPAPKDLIFKNTGKYFVIGNNPQVIDNFITGNKAAPPITDRIRDYPAFGFVDMQMLMKAIQPGIKDTSHQKLFDINKAMWDNADFYGGQFSNGGITTTFEMNLIDKNTNSLKQLNSYIDKVYPYRKLHFHDGETFKTDSTMMNVIPKP